MFKVFGFYKFIKIINLKKLKDNNLLKLCKTYLEEIYTKFNFTWFVSQNMAGLRSATSC